MAGEKIQIDNHTIYYEKHGNGNVNVVLIPGALGKWL